MKYLVLFILFYMTSAFCADSVEIKGSLDAFSKQEIIEKYEERIDLLLGPIDIREIHIYDKSFLALTMHRTLGNVVSMAVGTAPHIINDVDHYNVDVIFSKIIEGEEYTFSMECSSSVFEEKGIIGHGWGVEVEFIKERGTRYKLKKRPIRANLKCSIYDENGEFIKYTSNISTYSKTFPLGYRILEKKEHKGF